MWVGGQGAGEEGEELVGKYCTVNLWQSYRKVHFYEDYKEMNNQCFFPDDTSNFYVIQPSDIPVMKVTSMLSVLLHLRLVAITLAV